MAIFKRKYRDKETGEIKEAKNWSYEFVHDGERYQASTKTGNEKAARQIEAAERLRLAKGEAGIHDRKRAPTLAEFEERFEAEIETACSDKPETVRFYREKMRRLLNDSELAGARLDQIDKAMIDAYKQRRSREPSRYGTPMTVASVNRELAVLRRALRLAQEWDIIDRVPRIKMLRGERNRDFVISHALEPKYLAACPQPLQDAALLMLETGVRSGEAVALEWKDVHLDPAVHARFGYIRIRKGKSANAKRNLSLSERAAQMLRQRKAAAVRSQWVFPGREPKMPVRGTSLDHQHDVVREELGLPKDCVIHSLRHTMLTRLGEAGADAFSIMKIAGHSSVVVSQRYVHPTPEGLERAFERLQSLNAVKFEAAETEAKLLAANDEQTSLQKSLQRKMTARRKTAQVIEIKS